ncbi:hypothetical protein BCR44DRAFT_1422295 [Catenaria anguillulae PL171]|uniref:ATP synthase complex subunit H-domain-containing protein n=1 Tax=Catenaria anguillulae PL171 TaxID=765915 RepID=A0A1Y2I4L2_9FUNG|nr:hypothetical protein BCR44DRAFT_1422295 [Catenaria anguillulae PL171]
MFVAHVARAALKTSVPKATYVAPSSALFAKDILSDIALNEIRAFKPKEQQVTDPALTKKFTAPAPAAATAVPEVTKEELESYAKGE